jgi:hypothetical protein
MLSRELDLEKGLKKIEGNRVGESKDQSMEARRLDETFCTVFKIAARKRYIASGFDDNNAVLILTK